MSLKSKAVGDIVPLNCAKLLVDYTLLSEQLENIKLQVAEIGDEFAEKISSKMNKILLDVHNMDYFICGMRESLFKQAEQLVEVRDEEEGNVGAELKGIKRRNEDHAGSVTQSESVAMPKKKTRAWTLQLMTMPPLMMLN